MNLFSSTPKIIGVCLILMSTVVSCGRQEINSDHRVISKFPRTIALPDGDTCFAFDSDYGLINLSAAGEYLVGTLRKRERHFVVYTTDSIPRQAGLFGTSGKGPTEMMAPAYYGQWSCEDQQTKIWIYDRIKAEFVKVNIDSTLRDGRTIIEQKYDFHTGEIPDIRNLFYVCDTLLVGTVESDRCPMFRYNPVSRRISYLPETMNFDPGLAPQTLQEITQNLCAYNPQKRTVVSVAFSFPQVDFRPIDSLRFTTLFIDRILMPEQCIAQPRRTYFASVCGDSKYVYALWLDQDDDDFGDIEKPSSVLVFDWGGNPVARLEFAEYILGIAIDPTSARLFALNYYHDEHPVMVYNLKGILANDEK